MMGEKTRQELHAWLDHAIEADSPEKFARDVQHLLAELSCDARQGAEDVEATWQDKEAGRAWRMLATRLMRASDGLAKLRRDRKL